MASKNVIVLSVPPKGVIEGGIINDTSIPGTIMQIDAGQQKYESGRSYWKAAAPGTDGKQGVYGVLREDKKNGFPVGTAYVAGTPGEIYFPNPGEEFNALCGEVAGTGNTYAIGDKLMLDAENGILVPSSGSEQDTYAVVKEVVTQVAGSTLVRVQKTTT